MSNPQTQVRVLPDLAALQAQIDALTAKNELLAKQVAAKSHGNKASFRVTDASKDRVNAKGETVRDTTTGRIACYGVQRMPITLSYRQWRRLFNEIAPLLEAFATANADKVDMA